VATGVKHLRAYPPEQPRFHRLSAIGGRALPQRRGLTKQDERVLRAGDGREHAMIGGHGARYPEPRLKADLLPACVVCDPTGKAAFCFVF
jgi:hypothetical protein